MKRNKVSIWFYVVMAIVALINCIFQLINGTFYWGNGLVLIIFILVIIYKATRLYRKENLCRSARLCQCVCSIRRRPSRRFCVGAYFRWLRRTISGQRLRGKIPKDSSQPYRSLLQALYHEAFRKLSRSRILLSNTKNASARSAKMFCRQRRFRSFRTSQKRYTRI